MKDFRKKLKIIGTIGPARGKWRNKRFRINFSHGGFEENAKLKFKQSKR